MAARKKSSETEEKKTTKKKSSTTSKRASKASAEGAVAKGVTRKKSASAAAGDPNGKNLVIVESPAKAKTIQKYLGPNFEVAASYGHVRDLPPKPRGSNIGIDIEGGWIPTYINLEDDRHKAVMSDLKKKSSKANLIYLAPDPDREGEAIAWHLKEALGLQDDRVRRITFNEITKRAVKDAVDHPGQIDMDRVRAQEARRFLDRAVGYKLSPLLRKKIAKGLSAGRVQSVAVRLIVDREREIEAFQSEEYWKILAHLTPDENEKNPAIELRIVKKVEEAEDDQKDPDLDDQTDAGAPTTSTTMKAKPGKSFIAELAEWEKSKFSCKDETTAKRIGDLLTGSTFTVTKIEQKDRQERPQPPFTTSTLQQQANIRYGLSSRQTMSIAQQLYEGIEIGKDGSVGLITYMRTDSTRISQEALEGCRGHIKNQYGENYLPEKPNFYSSGKSAQEAHEAIRPTGIAYTPESVAQYMPTDGHRKVYDLIYRRFVASQMKPAIFAVTNIEIHAAEGMFKTQGKILKFDGYRKVLAPKGKQEDATLPPLEEKQTVFPLDVQASQHFTQPPPRYNEASLVKSLEKEGIGRPSTYATIISKIQERKYVEQQQRRFFATEMGKVVTDKLIQHFPDVMNFKFTSQMEEELDQIEERKAEWQKVLDKFWGPFSQALTQAQDEMVEVKNEATGEDCPKCGKPLVYRFSRLKGQRFSGCSGYPECDYIKRGEGEEDAGPIETDYECPNCGKKMLQRQGERGTFLGCSGYPECKTTMGFDAAGNPVVTSKSTEHTCEKCGKPLVLRQGKRGPFLGCSGYPKCRNIVEADEHGNPIKPAETGISCEKCNSPMVIKRGPRGPFLGCTGYPKCRSTKKMTDELKEQLKDKLPPERPKVETPEVEIKEVCPDCTGPLKLRRGRGGSYFLGCANYPKCKGTMQLTDEMKEKLQGTSV